MGAVKNVLGGFQEEKAVREQGGFAVELVDLFDYIQYTVQ